TDDFFRCDLEIVRHGENLLLNRGLKRMPWQDWDGTKEFQEWRKHFGGYDTDSGFVHPADLKALSVSLEQVECLLIEFRIVHDLVPGEDHIVGRERLAIAPAQSTA